MVKPCRFCKQANGHRLMCPATLVSPATLKGMRSPRKRKLRQTRSQ